MDHKDSKLVLEETVHAGFYRMVRLYFRHRLFKGGWSDTLEREVVLHGDVAVIVPYDPKTDRIVLLEQFRNGKFAAGDERPWSISIAAGMIEERENAEETARREIIEETGCQVGFMEKAMTFYSMPGGSSQRMTIFCAEVSAENAAGFYGLPEEGEDIRVEMNDWVKVNYEGFIEGAEFPGSKANEISFKIVTKIKFINN